jgi:hypothetical protein
MSKPEKSCHSCGVLLTKPRSEPDHRRFFALINAAFHHWPESHEFHPDNSEHLRAWLLCKAGYRDVATFELPETDDPVMMARMMEFAERLLEHAGDERRKFGRWRGSTFYVHQAKSIAWDKLSQKEFSPIREAVEEVISAEIGVDAEALLRERAA